MPKTLPHGGKDRRRLTRHTRRIPVRFQAGTLRGQGDIRNLHQEGLFIRCHVLPEPGSVVTINFTTPEGKKISVQGQVRWTTEQSPERAKGLSGFGVQLESPGQDYLDFFESLVIG